MKTISVKLPLSIYNELAERGQLNPTYVRNFINNHYNMELFRNCYMLSNHEINEPCAHYYFKIDGIQLDTLQQIAKKLKIPTNVLLGRLFDKHYKVY